jgi:hypothetical protein
MASVNDLPEEIIGEIIANGVSNIHFCGVCKAYMHYYWKVLGNYVLTLRRIHAGKLYHKSPLYTRRFLRSYMHCDSSTFKQNADYFNNIIVSIIRLDANSELEIRYYHFAVFYTQLRHTVVYKTYAKAKTFTINNWTCLTKMVLVKGKVLYSAIYHY